MPKVVVTTVNIICTSGRKLEEMGALKKREREQKKIQFSREVTACTALRGASSCGLADCDLVFFQEVRELVFGDIVAVPGFSTSVPKADREPSISEAAVLFSTELVPRDAGRVGMPPL